jgi:hypothetical protein
MLQLFLEQEKQRSRKSRGGSGDDLGYDYLLDDNGGSMGGADDFLGSVRKPTRAQLQMDKALRDIERIRASKNEVKDRKLLEEELKKVKEE